MRAKKYTSLVLAIIMSFSFVACGSNTQTESEPKGEIQTESSQTETETNNQTDTSEVSYGVGDTISGDLFVFTLNSAEFTDVIEYSASKDSDDFFIPYSAELVQGENKAILGNDEKTWLYFSGEFEYVGKDTFTLVSHCFIPTVKYDEYNLNSNYVTFMRINKKEWFNHSTDLLQSEIKGLGLSLGYRTSLKLEPLTDDTYEVKGAIQVPKKVSDNAEAEIILQFSMVDTNNSLIDFKIR